MYPPSTRISDPVTKLDSSLARNRIVSATSFGTPAFLVIRHLIAQNRRQSPLRHAGSPHYPLLLHQSGGGYNDHVITPPFAAALEEQRDIEDNDRLAPRAGKIDKPLLAGFDDRVKNSFEPRESQGIAKYTLAEERTINPAFRRANPGE